MAGGATAPSFVSQAPPRGTPPRGFLGEQATRQAALLRGQRAAIVSNPPRPQTLDGRFDFGQKNKREGNLGEVEEDDAGDEEEPLTPEQRAVSAESQRLPQELTQQDELAQAAFSGGLQAYQQGAGVTGSLYEATKQAARLAAEQQKAKLRAKGQAAARKAFKQMSQQSAIWIANGLASALNLGSAGLALVVDFVVYVLTFGWLNIQLFYGTYIARGQSFIIPPLSTEPFPVGIDRKSADLIYQLVIIVADLFLLLLLVCVLGFAAIMLWAIGNLLADPINFVREYGELVLPFKDLIL